MRVLHALMENDFLWGGDVVVENGLSGGWTNKVTKPGIDKNPAADPLGMVGRIKISQGVCVCRKEGGRNAPLLFHPDIAHPAIEETLRFESPVARQPRLMKADIDFGGFPFRKGEMVFQMLNAANRDPELFSNPDTFDIRRKDNRHMAFGHGIHFCIGAMLARTEAEIAIRTVLQRMPSIRFAEKPAEWDRDKRNGRMLKNLPVIL